MTSLTMSPATEADWPEIIGSDARAFVLPAPLPDDEIAEFRARFPSDATFVVRDDGRLAAFSMYFPIPLTVPGGDVVPTAGLSWVAVAATHRRRGILRTMMDAQFAAWRASGLGIAILTASEATIYERFGFGPAVFAHDIRIDPSAVEFRDRAPADSHVRYAMPDEVKKRVPEIHARWAASHPGAISRPDSWWPSILADRPYRRDSQTSCLHYLLHADGYASYRTDTRHHTATVEDFVAVTPQAHHDLWRVLTGLDLITAVHASVPVDDVLSHLVTNTRSVTVTGRPDTLWVSILDVADALSRRSYGADGSIVLDVADAYSDRAGRYEIVVKGGRATVSRTDRPAAVSLDIATLSSIYLGGVSARELALAGRIETTEECLTVLTQMFTVPRAPFAGTFF
ncbi:MAG: GNAT family N-acetyltransferase [Gordonia sp. (in: high G+C Gram-positive bacteria)]|nr:GNAT family N-acetyltransferase [Gordonia sp. (in: high G+C Gram-positive bacteria)]